MLELKIRKVRETAAPLTYGTPESAAFDLATCEDAVIPPKTLKLLKTGWVFGCPDGYFLAIFSRSSTPKRGLMIPNGVGVLDYDYRGATDEAGILVYNFTDEPVAVTAGDRLAQGILLPCPRPTFVDFSPSDASRGGFGSTGK